MSLRLVMLGVALGLLVEACAWLFRWWEFRRTVFVVVQVAIMYGLIMGSLAGWLPRLGYGVVFAIAFLLGLCSELLNLAFFHWWRFLDGRDDTSWARLVGILVLALAWGAAPIALARADVAIARALRPKTPADVLVTLEERKKHLLARREALLARLRDVDNRLRAVERRKRDLQRKLTPRSKAPAAEVRDDVMWKEVP